jgi:hypothetical protein
MSSHHTTPSPSASSTSSEEPWQTSKLKLVMPIPVDEISLSTNVSISIERGSEYWTCSVGTIDMYGYTIFPREGKCAKGGG